MAVGFGFGSRGGRGAGFLSALEQARCGDWAGDEGSPNRRDGHLRRLQRGLLVLSVSPATPARKPSGWFVWCAGFYGQSLYIQISKRNIGTHIYIYYSASHFFFSGSCVIDISCDDVKQSLYVRASEKPGAER